jgi:hypothetical protein
MGDTSVSGLRKMDDMVVQVASYWDALESAKHTTYNSKDNNYSKNRLTNSVKDILKILLLLIFMLTLLNLGG